MADPTLEQVATAWAGRVTSDILEDIEEQDLVPGGYLDDIRDVIMAHLTDVTIANANRATQALSKEPGGTP